MAVYVDSEHIEWRGRTWCHLVADSLDELHAFAKRLGLETRWFQARGPYPHYDVTASMQRQALQMGALLADRRTVVECCRRMRAELRASGHESVQSVLVFAAD
jgi:hypothetical protein